MRRIAGAVALVFLAASCSSGGSDSNPTSTASPQYPVGVRTHTFTRSPQSTVGNTDGEAPARALQTTIFYPASGVDGGEPHANAPANRRDGPFPLIVFAHGFGGSPEGYEGLLEDWARSGYVVAAPRFPNTNATAEGGVDAGDFINQPADVSSVITGALELSAGADGALAGIIEPKAVGVGGHSLGGITALGVAANSCCRDRRIKAAVVLSGDPLTFPDGDFDYAKAPPILLVHGAADDLVPYEASVEVFNAAKPPKALLTIKRGDHGAPMNPSGPAFATVARSTVAFFDAYLKGDADGGDQLEKHGRSRTTKVVVAFERGVRWTIPTAPPVVRDLHVTVSPDADLTNGQMVTVEWSGFTPGKTINIVQCSNRTPGDVSACDLVHGKILQPNPTGSGSLLLEVVTGPVGTGVCDSDHGDCQIVVNDGGSLDPDASVRSSLAFAPV